MTWGYIRSKQHEQTRTAYRCGVVDNTEQFWRKILLRAIASAKDDNERSKFEDFYLKVQAIISGHKVLFKCYNRETYRAFVGYRFQLLNEIKQVLNQELLSMTVEVAELDMQQEMQSRMEEIIATNNELHYEPTSKVIPSNSSPVDSDLPLFASVPNQELFQGMPMPLEQAFTPQNQAQSQFKTQPQDQAQFPTQTQSQSQALGQDQAEAQAQIQPEIQVQTETQIQVEPPVQVPSQIQPQEQHQVQAEPQTLAQAQIQAQAQFQIQPQNQPTPVVQSDIVDLNNQASEQPADLNPDFPVVKQAQSQEPDQGQSFVQPQAQELLQAQPPVQVQPQVQGQSQEPAQGQTQTVQTQAQAQVQAQFQRQVPVQPQSQVAPVNPLPSVQLPTTQAGQSGQTILQGQTIATVSGHMPETTAESVNAVPVNAASVNTAPVNAAPVSNVGNVGNVGNVAMPASPVFNQANQQFIAATPGAAYPQNLQSGNGSQVQSQIPGQVQIQPQAQAQVAPTQIVPGQVQSHGMPGHMPGQVVYVNQQPYAPQPGVQVVNSAVVQGQIQAQMPGQVPGQIPGQMPGQVPPRTVYVQYPAQGQPQPQLFDAYGNPVVLTNIPPGFTTIASPITPANQVHQANQVIQAPGAVIPGVSASAASGGTVGRTVGGMAPVAGAVGVTPAGSTVSGGAVISGFSAVAGAGAGSAAIASGIAGTSSAESGVNSGTSSSSESSGSSSDKAGSDKKSESKKSSSPAGLFGLGGLPMQGLAAGPGLPDTMSYRYAKVKINYPIMDDGSELAGARMDTEWAKKMTEAENAAHKSAQERVEYDSGMTYAMLDQTTSLNSDQPEIESIKFDFGNVDDEEPNRYKSLVESLTLDTEPDNDYDDVGYEPWPKNFNSLRPEDCLVDINLPPERQVEELTKLYKDLSEQFQENRDRYDGCHEALIHARQDKDRLSCTTQMHDLEIERKELDQKLEQCRVQLKSAKDQMEDAAKRKEDEAPLLNPIQAMSGLLSSEINGGMLQADEELIEMSSHSLSSNWEDIPGHNEFRKCKINPCKTFANFVPAPENRSVLNTAQLIAANPGDTKFNPFYIYGASGLGKTHLINAIANAITKNKPEIEVTYTRAEDFIFNYVVAIKQAQAMRRQHRKFEGKAMIDPRDLFLRCMNSQIFIIDDVQNFSKAAKSRDAFFEIIAEFIDKPNCQLILASDVPPATLLDHGFNPRLTSRFGSGVCCEVRLPSIGPRRTIASAKSIEAGIKLSENLIDYIANHIQTNIREIEGAVKTLNSNIVNQGFISMNEAMMSLEAFIPRPKLANQLTNGLTLDVIKVQVAREFLVTVQDLESGSKKKVVTTARAMAMALSKQLIPGTTLMDLGRAFNKDHSSVSDAIRRIFKRMDAESELKSMYEHFVHEFQNFRGQS